ncbi:MAG: hypothetical protein RIC18_00610 [Hoeflea sp.]|uniref:hypothetical protein n=1 Tax=Hoeflea sp. TaxID=1940281 RepID=UPI0032EB278F
MAKPHASNTDLTETDLARDKMGRNSLKGDDQARTRNQREAVAEVKKEPDKGVVDSLEKMDKDTRAKTELGKGARKPG